MILSQRLQALFDHDLVMISTSGTTTPKMRATVWTRRSGYTTIVPPRGELSLATSRSYGPTVRRHRLLMMMILLLDALATRSVVEAL